MSELKRYIVRRHSDGRFLCKDRAWTDDINKARVFNQRGHIKLALLDYSIRAEYVRLTDNITPNEQWERQQQENKRAKVARDISFNYKYEILEVRFERLSLK